MTFHTISDVPVPYGRVVPRLKQEEEEIERPWQERTFGNFDSFDNINNFDTFENLNYAKVWRGGGRERKERKATQLPRGEEEGGGSTRFKLCGR